MVSTTSVTQKITQNTYLSDDEVQKVIGPQPETDYSERLKLNWRDYGKIAISKTSTFFSKIGDSLKTIPGRIADAYHSSRNKKPDLDEYRISLLGNEYLIDDDEAVVKFEQLPETVIDTSSSIPSNPPETDEEEVIITFTDTDFVMPSTRTHHFPAPEKEFAEPLIFENSEDSEYSEEIELDSHAIDFEEEYEVTEVGAFKMDKDYIKDVTAPFILDHPLLDTSSYYVRELPALDAHSTIDPTQIELTLSQRGDELATKISSFFSKVKDKLKVIPERISNVYNKVVRKQDDPLINRFSDEEEIDDIEEILNESETTPEKNKEIESHYSITHFEAPTFYPKYNAKPNFPQNKEKLPETSERSKPIVQAAKKVANAFQEQSRIPNSGDLEAITSSKVTVIADKPKMKVSNPVKRRINIQDTAKKARKVSSNSFSPIVPEISNQKNQKKKRFRKQNSLQIKTAQTEELRRTLSEQERLAAKK